LRFLSNTSAGSGRLAFGSSGRWLYGLLGEGLVGWDLHNGDGQPAWSVRGVYGHHLAVSRCGRWIVVVSHGDIRVLDTAAAQRPHQLWPESTGRTVDDAMFTPDGEELLAVCHDPTGDGRFDPGRIRSWQVGGWNERPAAPRPPLADRPEQSWLTGRLAVSPDGTRLAAQYQVSEGGVFEHGLTLWDRGTGGRLAEATIQGTIVGRLLFTADGAGLLGDQFRSLVRYGAETLSVTAVFAAPAGSNFDELAVSPGGQRVAVGAGEQVVVLDATSLRPVAGYDFGLGPMVRVAFAPDGQTAAACGQTGRVVIFDVE
jgi:hypothetical protein